MIEIMILIVCYVDNRFTHLPSDYKDDLVTEVAKELSAIRQKTVIPLLKKYSKVAMNDGLPLLRPLWMLDPQDPACLYVNDEFSIGDELIVAPILIKGQVQREGINCLFICEII